MPQNLIDNYLWVSEKMSSVKSEKTSLIKSGTNIEINTESGDYFGFKTSEDKHLKEEIKTECDINTEKEIMIKKIVWL